MALIIRKAKKQDCPLILDFIKLLARYERLESAVSASSADLENTIFGKSSFVRVILAFEDYIPVGFALFFFNYSTFLAKPGIYLEDLYVKEEFRGKGYGKKLLQYIARLAIENNCGRFEWSVLDWNKPSIEFYKKLGAEAMDEWTVYRLTGKALENLAGK